MVKNIISKLVIFAFFLFLLPVVFANSSLELGLTSNPVDVISCDASEQENICDVFKLTECTIDSAKDNFACGYDNESNTFTKYNKNIDELKTCKTLDCDYIGYCANNSNEVQWAPSRRQCLIGGEPILEDPTIILKKETSNQTITITLFYGDTCPHCHDFIEYAENELLPNNSQVKLVKYEVYNNYTNQLVFKKWVNDYNVKSQGVPTFFINDRVFQGYSERMNDDIEGYIYECLNETSETQSCSDGMDVELPFFGKVHLHEISLPLITVMLGFLDGFNPCAFFVLLFLLSMLVYAKSRKRMLIIGGTFVFFSGLIYFLFMTAWLNFFLVTKEITLITTVAGIVALIIATIDIKDFFFLNKGVSLSISKDNKTKLIKKMRGLMKADNMFSMMVGTIVLAITANMYELLCTAGFPMVFTKMLVLNNLSSFSYYMYLLLYNIIYVVPLLVIVLIFTYSLGAKKLSDKQGEVLKLMSGNMMLFLGILLVFFPDMLNNLMSAVVLIGLAIVTTFITIKAKKYFSKKDNKKRSKTDNESEKKKVE